MAALTRVCLTGAESTGKSELAQELARDLSVSCVPEFAREYALKVARPLAFTDVDPIARGQIALQERASANASGLLILDTDLLSTVVYARHYWGVCPEWIEREARAGLANLYLLLDIDVPWVPDPARDVSADRRALHEQFEQALAEFGAKYLPIGGRWAERKRKAIDSIQAAQ